MTLLIKDRDPFGKHIQLISTPGQMAAILADDRFKINFLEW